MRFQNLRHRFPSPAMAVALLALFLAMGGSALAAHHYLISSTSQINPKVLKKLKGATGKTGAAGTPGAPGAPGAKGETGSPGPAAVKFFARVASGATPTLDAGSPGVTVSPTRVFTGASEVTFPQDVSKCAVIAMGVSGGSEIITRQSSIATGSHVAIVTEDVKGSGINEAYNLIAAC